jgi:hypothetical protein
VAESNAARDANAFARTSAGAGPWAPQTADSERRKPGDLDALRREQWAEIVGKFERGGLSHETFCARQLCRRARSREGDSRPPHPLSLSTVRRRQPGLSSCSTKSAPVTRRWARELEVLDERRRR